MYFTVFFWVSIAILIYSIGSVVCRYLRRELEDKKAAQIKAIILLITIIPYVILHVIINYLAMTGNYESARTVMDIAIILFIILGIFKILVSFLEVDKSYGPQKGESSTVFIIFSQAIFSVKTERSELYYKYELKIFKMMISGIFLIDTSLAIIQMILLTRLGD